MQQTIKFKSTQEETSFFDEIKKNVADYFSESKISSLANTEMIVKITFWILFWAVSWIGVILFKDYFFVAFLLGTAHMLTHTMIAFNFVHDANHDAVFKSKAANNILAYFIELLGVNRKIWLVAHNQEHHTFINIHKHDSNIEGYGFLRLCPEDKWLRHHKYQWLYAPFVYGLAGLNFATIKDFKLISRYARKEKLDVTFKFLLEFIFFRLVYLTYIFIIPIVVFNVSFKLILLYYFVGHFLNGILLAMIFVTGHLTETVAYPPVTNHTVNNNWAVHVISTTGDYATESTILPWLVGGLNLHVAHHLFPKICHVHYKDISPIIKKTALKHGYAYREIPTFSTALKSHFSLLKTLSNPAYK